METSKRLAVEHIELSRRYFLGLGAAGIAGLGASIAWADPGDPQVLADAIAKLSYLTPAEQFRATVRGTPPIHMYSPEKLREAGLDPETWRLEVVPDPESDCKVEHPLSKELGTALDWQGLMKLAEKSAVRYSESDDLHEHTRSDGMGLWEGVPLREVIWLTRPKANLRRVFYYGYDSTRSQDVVPKLAADRPRAGRPARRAAGDPLLQAQRPVAARRKLAGRCGWSCPTPTATSRSSGSSGSC